VSKLIDDSTLAQYLERNSEFSARYREIETDTVPSELDGRVLAQAGGNSAARQLTGSSHASGDSILMNWRRYSAPIALAATVVLAVSIVVQVGDRRVPTSLIVQEGVSTGSPNAADGTVPFAYESAPQPLPPAFEPNADVQARDSRAPGSVAQNAVDRNASEPLIAFTPEAALREQFNEEGRTASASKQKSVSRTAGATPTPAVPKPATAAPAPVAALGELPEKSEEFAANSQLDAISTDRYRGKPSDSSIQVMPERQLAKQAAPNNKPTAPWLGTAGTAPNSSVPPVAPAMSASRSEAARNEPAEMRTRATAKRQVAEQKAQTPRSTTPAVSKEVRERTAKLWLAHIRDLREAGNEREANLEWQRYLKSFPKYPVAPEDPARPRE
jgi:hypothetical protein